MAVGGQPWPGLPVSSGYEGLEGGREGATLTLSLFFPRRDSWPCRA